MSRYSLSRNFAWALAANVGHALAQWGMLVTLAKFGSASMVGEYALAIAITTPVILFANLQLREVQATDSGSDRTFADYLGLRTITTGIAVVAIVLYAFAGASSAHLAATIALVGIAKCVESLCDVFHGLYQRYERMDSVTRSLLVKGVLALGAWCLGLSLTGAVLGGVAGVLVAALITLAFVDRRSALQIEPGRRILPRYERAKLGALFRAVWPLGASTCLLSITTNIPRYFIGASHGAAALGIFAGMAYLMTAGTMLMMALSQSASPRLARLLAAGEHEAAAHLLRSQLALAGLLGASGVVGAALFGRPLLALIYTPEFATETRAFVWVMVAAGVGYLNTVFAYSLTAAREMRVQLTIEVSAAVVTLAGSALLVPIYGLEGAGGAVLAGAVARLATQALRLRSAWSVRGASATRVPMPLGAERTA